MPIHSSRAVGLILPMVCLAYPSLDLAETRGVPHQRVAFVTSASGPPVFGDWPEATGSFTGLEAADSICANLASKAGLLSPGDFRAWVSDSSDDAYCRIHRQPGKKSADCGLPGLPELAGPWVRTDGTPWAAAVPELLDPDHVVYTPLHLDENGQAVELSERVWTATGNDGELSNLGVTCTDWTATPDENVTFGDVGRTSSSWTNRGSVSCATKEEHRLYCLETTPGPALNLDDPPERLAFLSSARGNGALGTWGDADLKTEGIEAGDSICNNLAQDAGLPGFGSYKAWLSDMDIAAPDRFDNDGPWYRLDGVRIAENMADLIDSELLTAINLTEEGEYRPGGAVWTGTTQLGAKDNNHCNSWMSNDGASFSALVGAENAANKDWTASHINSCGPNLFLGLYCLSDALPQNFFTEGFEAQ